MIYIKNLEDIAILFGIPDFLTDPCQTTKRNIILVVLKIIVNILGIFQYDHSPRCPFISLYYTIAICQV